MQQNIQMKTNEIQREGRKKDRLERELRQAKADLDTKASEIKSLQQSLEQSGANVTKLNGDLKEQKVGEFPILFSALPFCMFLPHRCRRQRGWGHGHMPPPKKKIQEKYFSDDYYVKFGHFLQKSCKTPEFC